MEEIKYEQVPLPKGKAAWNASNIGFNEASRQRSITRMHRLVEATRMWNGFLAGEVDPLIMREAFKAEPSNSFRFAELNKIAPHIFHEAMTRSDFTNLTTFVLDRMMLDNYATYNPVYAQIAKVNRNIRDFRSVERWVTDGGEGPWNVVEELEGFNRKSISSSSYTYKVAKYEGGMQVSWEAVINDDMNMFKELPVRLATGGLRTIELFFANLIADANGPHASYFTTGNANIINTTNYGGGSANPALSYQALAGALAQLMNMMTAENRPINPASDSVKVVVCDGFMWQTLLNIINTQFTATTIVGGTKASSAVTADTTLQIRNWLSGRIVPVFMPELRNVITASSGAVAARTWFVFMDSAARPAVEIGHLTGFDTPQLFRKLPNTVRISGGTADEMGDFETMSTEIKGMTVVGGTRLDVKAAIASNGSGS